MRVKVTERSALVQVAASTQQLTSHAGLVLVRELADRLGVGELLDRLTVKKRQRGYSSAQAILGLCETLIVGGECLDDVALLRADSAQERLRGHGLPEPCAASVSAISASSTVPWTSCSRVCIRLSGGRR